MLAQNNEYLQETVSGVRQLTAEEQIRQQCQAREDYIYWEGLRAAEMKRLEDELAKSKAALADKDAQLAESNAALAESNTALAEQQAENARLRTLLKSKSK